jgi:predicted aspartyl protease
MPGLAAMIALTAAMTVQQNATATRLPPSRPVQSAKAQPVYEDGETPVETVQAGTDRETRLTVPVSIEGKGPFRFMVDTGSQNTVLSRDLATQLALESGPRVQIVSVAEIMPADTVHIEALDLGQLTLFGLQVPLLEEHHMGAEGILGTDALQNRRVLLDFAHNRMEIADARARGSNSGYEIVVQARRRSGQLIMTNARIDGINVDLVLDTGGGTSVGNRALQAALGKRGRNSQQVSLLSVTGQSVLADIGYASKLEIEEVTVTNLVIAFTDSPAFAALNLTRKPALFLGMREMRLFRRVAIDFRTRRLLFDLPG